MNSVVDRSRIDKLITVGDDRGVIAMLDEGYDPLESREGQLSILLFMKAVGRCGPDVLKTMVAKGVDPLARDGVGRTAMFASNAKNHQTLLDMGLRVEDRDKDGYTPLIQAAREISRYQGLSHTLRSLLSLNADPNGLDNNFMSPLMHLSNSASGQHVAAVDALVQSGADVHHRDTKGQNALIYAVVVKSIPPMARVLLAHGARFDPRSGQLERAAFAAIKINDIETLKELSLHGFNAQDDPGKWLNHAFFNGAVSSTLHLLESGALAGFSPGDASKWKAKKASPDCMSVLKSFRSRQAAEAAIHEIDHQVRGGP